MKTTLFPIPKRGAKFSNDRKRRFYLYRIWNRELPLVAFVGLNPSTANETIDDPTIRRLLSWTNSKGYGGFYMFNLFTVISPDPKVLHADVDRFEDNFLEIVEANNEEKFAEIVFCWGNFNVYGRDKLMEAAFPDARVFGRNINGSPKHPLYLPKGVNLKTI